MLSEKLQKLLNDQINYEYYSAYTYLAMSAYADSNEFPGIANFFMIQAQEEMEHAKRIYTYMPSKGGDIELEAIEKPKKEYKDVFEIFDEGLSHEQEVTRRIYHIADVALEEKEHATMSFIKWFIDEQVEEEESFSLLVKKAKRALDNPAALYLLDDELASRTLHPAAK